MDLGLKGKVAVVTGSSRGLGKAIAHALAAEGATLAICSRTESSIKDVARDISDRYHTEVHWEARNLVTPGEAEKFIKGTIERFGGVDVLVNNVGTGYTKPFEDITDDEWQNLLEINLKVAISCSRAALPTMKQHGRGKIVNIAALSGKMPRLGQTGSNVAKAALINFTESLAREFAPYGIRVNAVCPAAVLTDRWVERVNKVAKGRGVDFDTAMQAMAKGVIPLGRFGSPEEVAAAVAFLASDKSDFITGNSIMLDGGVGTGVSMDFK